MTRTDRRPPLAASRPLRIGIVTPHPRGARTGNRVTALRWAGLLRQLGHQPRIETDWTGQDWDVMIALHARKSGAAIDRFAETHPDRPLVVSLTGTDLYGDLQRGDEDSRAWRSVRRATRLVTLQPRALREIPEALHERTHVIRQSASPPPPGPRSEVQGFAVIAIAHLREVKDPFLAAEATRLLPEGSAVRVRHVGGAYGDDDTWAERARAESERNPRWTWCGLQPRAVALRHLQASDLLVLTSRSEGGANVVSEALACGVPVLSTRIDGTLGQLGESYPGYVPVGDAGALAAALHRAETDDAWLASLAAHCEHRRPLFHPDRERRAWRELLDTLGPASGPRPPASRSLP